MTNQTNPEKVYVIITEHGRAVCCDESESYAKEHRMIEGETVMAYVPESQVKALQEQIQALQHALSRFVNQ